MFFSNGGHPIEWAPDIGTWTGLAVIVGAMAVATIASLLRMRADTRRSRTPTPSSSRTR